VNKIKLARLVIPFVLLLLSAPSPATDTDQFLKLETDPKTGKVLLTLNSFPADFLYVTALRSGAGSNDLGLDRGMLDRSRWVRFERYGSRVLMLEPNLKFRAGTLNPWEKAAVSEAFAQSVLAGFEVVDEGEDGVRLDLAPLLISDITRISGLITELEQGSFELDPDRSVVDAAGISNFPENTLIPVVLTFKGSEPGAFIKDVTPTADSLTVRVTHQFASLPNAAYRTRDFHPRSGYFSRAYRDYAVPLDQAVDRRVINRHRLQAGGVLTYYVDNGTPEPMRSALLEGASWWLQAFEAAGFPGGFRVEVLPEGVDPLDIRYNVIQWVHRSTRGWSYGGSVTDPRTGEIIKGHVSLGSLRVRQDQMIAEALTAPFTGEGNRSDAATQMALARLRQLSAHEVGHTLGLDHNFAASFSGDPSVMDYPHPDLYLDEDGKVRLDRAYKRGVSEWDRLAIRYGYTVFSAGAESQGLAGILQEAQDRGIAFINDRDARVPGAAHPSAHLWDNGNDVLTRLGELLEIRRMGLNNFSTAVLPPGSPMFEMEQRLVPVFLLHRYQLKATAKLIGGLHYSYGLKEDEAPVLRPVDAATQRLALERVLHLLQPAMLALPEQLRMKLPPPPSGFSRDRESFPGATGPSFDHLAPARAGADLVIRELLQPQRLARMDDQHALNPEYPEAAEVIDALLQASWRAKTSTDGYLAAIQAEVEWSVLQGLMKLSGERSSGDVTRAAGTSALIFLGRTLEKRSMKGDAQAAAAAHEIRKFLDRQATDAPVRADPAPPGSPIG
jgi:hypothetical protein